MPDNQLFNTAGFTTAPTTIGNVAGASGFTGFTGNTSQRTTVRVTGITGINGMISYEFVKNNYGKSSLGSPDLTKVAIPSTSTSINMPEIGEYVEIFSNYDPIASSQNKANPINVVYWDSVKGPLNIWNELTGSQKNLDPTVPNQVQNNKMTNLNPINYTNSLNGFI